MTVIVKVPISIMMPLTTRPVERGRREICQKTQCRSTLMSMLTIHHNIGGTKDCGFQSMVSKAMDAYRTFHTAANGVEWYERTPNDE
ncbi:hypothetical protein TNCV_520711 [Trichonephila clavipes]|nr:hypothetical protein TNCV_520711 [Trichonephila clavipes]